MPLTFTAGWRECHDMIKTIIRTSGPCFIGRLGGSDTDAIADRLTADSDSSSAAREAAMRHLHRVQEFNGYYDEEKSSDKYLAFLDLLLRTYVVCDKITFVDAKLLTLYFPSMINPIYHQTNIPLRRGFERIVNAIAAKSCEAQAFPYTFYETLTGKQNLFRVFEESLRGKRVLVVSPFETSIRSNWGRRARFFRDFQYPEFHLLTVNSPITYKGLPPDCYPHGDWFETLNALIAEIRHIDFDIALLSCGSYAMPIGTFISAKMGKTAIYVGGILQLFFGIMGRRYENPFYLTAINRDAFIRPIERERFLAHVPVRSDAPLEHFGAYF
jgi:hypothetical protein